MCFPGNADVPVGTTKPRVNTHPESDKPTWNWQQRNGTESEKSRRGCQFPGRCGRVNDQVDCGLAAAAPTSLCLRAFVRVHFSDFLYLTEPPIRQRNVQGDGALQREEQGLDLPNGGSAVL